MAIKLPYEITNIYPFESFMIIEVLEINEMTGIMYHYYYEQVNDANWYYQIGVLAKNRMTKADIYNLDQEGFWGITE